LKFLSRPQVPAPSVAGDAANKGYVDSVGEGGGPHASTHITDNEDRIPDAQPYVDAQNPGAPGLMSALDKKNFDQAAAALLLSTHEATPYTLVMRNGAGYADVGPPNKHGNSAHNEDYATASELALKEPAFTKNTAFNKNFGSTAGTVAKGEELGNLTSLKTAVKSSLVGAVNELVDKNFVFFGTYEEWN
jgi:hypothetical protein